MTRGPYQANDDEWIELGVTPLEVRLPRSLSRVRFELDGYRPVLSLVGYPGGIGGVAPDEQVRMEPVIRLDTPESLPERMVRVSGTLNLPSGPTPSSFFLGRYEVINAEFKAFVDDGGYETRDFWNYPIVVDDEEIAWEAAMELFVDDFGFVGPSTWELGDYPDGEDDYPVRGISWYEAAAYAEWVGAELPTIHHWRAAVPRTLSSARTPASNLNVAGSAGRAVPVGQFDSPNRFGAYDVSGNVREWIFNAIGNLRYVAGGAWNDPPWLSDEPEIVQPINRDETNGFRVVQTFDDDETRRQAREDVSVPDAIDHFVPRAIGDETFESYREFFAYDPVTLEAETIERIEDKYWVREQVAINTAYGERMPVYLYLPRNSDPPYRTIVHVPEGGAWFTPSIEQYEFRLDGLVRAGYAVAMPIYKGSFERIDAIGISFQNWDSQQAVERIREVVRDAMVSIDYLVTRDDIDSSAFTYFGLSMGSVFSPIVLANEPRFELAILASGGFSYLNDRFRPSIDPGRYLNRVKQPVLMINGEFDELFPLKTHIKAFHSRLGSTEKTLHVVPGAGHALARESVFRESIAWLESRF